MKNAPTTLTTFGSRVVNVVGAVHLFNHLCNFIIDNWAGTGILEHRFERKRPD